MRILLIVVMMFLPALAQSQAAPINRWILTPTQIEYQQCNNLNNEPVSITITKVNPELFVINGLEFYMEKNYCASFPGGKDSLSLFIRNRLEYQPYNKVCPTIVVAFIVSRDGEILHSGVLRGAENNYDKAALDLIDKMPKWSPAKKNGKSIASFNTLAIDFTIK